jgi:hypothetical protein
MTPGETAGVVLGTIFGLFAVAGVLVAVWIILGKRRTGGGGDEIGDVEFETESDVGSDIITDVDEAPSGYHSEDMDQVIADEFAFAAVFTFNNDEAATQV